MTLLVPIVEGHGEREAVPSLFYRIAAEVNPEAVVRVNEPIRVKSGSFINDHAFFARYVNLAAAKAAQSPPSCVVILLDCDDGCPAQLGPLLRARAEAERPDVNFLVALARREYETWFLTAARSLRGICGLTEDLEPPIDPEIHRDAKGWLGGRMATPYDPIAHQLPMTRAFSLQEARASQSFARLVDRLSGFL